MHPSYIQVRPKCLNSFSSEFSRSKTKGGKSYRYIPTNSFQGTSQQLFDLFDYCYQNKH